MERADAERVASKFMEAAKIPTVRILQEFQSRGIRLNTIQRAEAASIIQGIIAEWSAEIAVRTADAFDGETKG